MSLPVVRFRPATEAMIIDGWGHRRLLWIFAHLYSGETLRLELSREGIINALAAVLVWRVSADGWPLLENDTFAKVLYQLQWR